MRLVVDLVKAIPAAKPLLAPLAEGLVESFRLRAARQASQAEVQDEARAVDPLTAVMSALSDHPDQQLAAIVAKFLEGHREPA